MVCLPARDFSTTRWIAASNAVASIGLTKCSKKPAALLWARSVSEPKPLIAMPRSLCLVPNSLSKSQPEASGTRLECVLDLEERLEEVQQRPRVNPDACVAKLNGQS